MLQRFAGLAARHELRDRVQLAWAEAPALGPSLLDFDPGDAEDVGDDDLRVADRRRDVGDLELPHDLLEHLPRGA